MKKLLVLLVLLCLVSPISAQEDQQTFTKVGDSITYSWAYLFDVAVDVDLAGYGYLQEVIDHYSIHSFLINPPIAAYPGWTSGDVLKVGNAKLDGCKELSPLVCAYAVENPSVALILLGTNDVAQNIPLDVYRTNMEQIVQISQDRGVTPVLITIPPFEGKDVNGYNAVIRTLAAARGAPLIDYGADSVSLPNQGLSGDGVHPSESPDKKDAYFDTEHLQYGFNVLNLRILQMLYRTME